MHSKNGMDPSRGVTCVRIEVKETVDNDASVEPQRSGGQGLIARWSRATTIVQQDEKAQAISSMRAFLVFCILANLTYVVFYLLSDPGTLGHVLGVNTTATIACFFALLIGRAGHQLASSVFGLTVTFAETLLCSLFLGWSAGFHLYLLLVGQLVFMVFTESQRTYRWLFLVLAASIFVYCQLFIENERGSHFFSSNARLAMFSMNVVGTGALLLFLAMVAHLRGREAQAEARAATARAEYLANTDALTGLMNRRPIMLEFERLDGMESGAYCVGIADLDRFKELNDIYGHTCGDRILAVVGRTFRTHVRVTDVVGRWGGEEFIFILHETSLADATALMERLREEIASLSIAYDERIHKVTASFGVADGEGGSLSFHVVRRADDAMYDAKAAGRNAVRARPLATTDETAAREEVHLHPLESCQGHPGIGLDPPRRCGYARMDATTRQGRLRDSPTRPRSRLWGAVRPIDCSSRSGGSCVLRDRASHREREGSARP